MAPKEAEDRHGIVRTQVTQVLVASLIQSPTVSFTFCTTNKFITLSITKPLKRAIRNPHNQYSTLSGKENEIRIPILIDTSINHKPQHPTVPLPIILTSTYLELLEQQ